VSSVEVPHQLGVRRFRGDPISPPDVVPWRVRRSAPPKRIEDAGAPTMSLGGLNLSVDGLLAFGLFLSMLFITEFTTKSAAAFVGLVPLYAFLRRKDFLQLMGSRGLLLVIPALALFSIAWSEAPSATLKYAIEFGVTLVAAFLLSSARDQEAVLRGLAAAFLLYVAVSVAVGRSVGVGVGAGGEAFSGLTDSKNLIADIASTAMMISVLVGLLALCKRDLFWMAIAAVAVLLDAHVLMAARSAGAMVGLAAGLAAMLGLLPLVVMPQVVRGMVTLVISIAVVFAAFAYQAIAAGIMSLGLAMFDKDPTLTGRTYLWYRAGELIGEKPLLGRGYSAFWLQGNIDAEGLWRFAGITGRSGFSFHNAAVQILVELGWLGLVVIGAIVVISTCMLAIRLIRHPTPFLCLWMAILLYELCRTPIEAIGLAPLSYSTVLLFGAFGAGFGALRPALRRAPARPSPRFQRVAYTARGAGRAVPTVRTRPGVSPIRVAPPMLES
jgi:exopolysaccharide production protein ExoQ